MALRIHDIPEKNPATVYFEALWAVAFNQAIYQTTKSPQTELFELCVRIELVHSLEST